jgi:hypothetical protein
MLLTLKYFKIINKQEFLTEATGMSTLVFFRAITASATLAG